MGGIWGLATNYSEYSSKSRELFYSIIQECRNDFAREFCNALDNYRESGLYDSRRFYDSDKVFWALQSGVKEEDFTQLPKHYIFRVLLGACKADYYYQFEKEW